MQKRLLTTIAGLATFTMVALLLTAGESSGQTDPPASGDWVVADTTVVQDRTVDLDGDLVVTSTGSLTLENVTLRIHLQSDGEHGIEVRSGGELDVRDGDGKASTTSDASNITAAPATRSYYLIARDGSTLRLTNSLITRCGHTGMAGSERLGIYVATDDAVVSGVLVDDCLHGLVLDQAVLRVEGSSITNCTYHGISSTDSDMVVANTTLADNGYEGIRVVRGNARIEGCWVGNNRNGVVVRTGAVVTLENTTVRGNTEGLLTQIGPEVTVIDCTFRRQTRYGIHAENLGELTLRGTTVSGAARSGLFANNGITVASSGSAYNSNVYGVRLNMNCAMTSSGDTFRGNTNSGIYLETTSDLTIVDGLITDNSAGIKGEGGSSVVAWATTVSECDFEGYRLANTDLELYDGHILNCTGGAIAPDDVSDTDWTVHAGNSSSLLNCDADINGDLTIHGDMVISQAALDFKHDGAHLYGVSGYEGELDWRNVTVRPQDAGGVIGFSLLSDVTGSIWHLSLERTGRVGTSVNDPMQVLGSLGFHRCTFKDLTTGISIRNAVAIDRCQFTDALVHVSDGDLRFDNCSFSTSGTNTIEVGRGGTATLVNSTFDPAKVLVTSPTGSWSAWWVVHVEVSFPSGLPAPGALVTVTDAKGSQVFQGTASPQGRVIGLLVLQHVTTQTAEDARTPHVFNATSGASYRQTSVTVDGHMTVQLLLVDDDPPVIQVTSHSDGNHVTTPTLVLQGTVTDAGSGVYQVEGRVSTQPWSLATGKESWEWTYTFSADGTYPITIRARDMALNEAFYFLNITLDTTPPRITITPPTPNNNSLVSSERVTIAGYLDKAEAEVFVGNVTANMSGTEFSAEVRLVDGTNVIAIRAMDLAGNMASLEWVLEADLAAPELDISRPVNGSLLNATKVLVEGSTASFAKLYFRVLEVDTTWKLVTVTALGEFSFEAKDLVQGLNHLELMARDAAGNDAVVALELLVDTIPPQLVSVSPSDGRHVRTLELRVNGTMSEVLSALSIGTTDGVVNGTEFSIQVPLTEGTNYLRLVATDLAGNEDMVTLFYVLDTKPPGLEIAQTTWNDSSGAFDPIFTNLQFLNIHGSTDPGSTVTIDGWPYEVDEAGQFVATLELEEDENVLPVLVRDMAGNELLTNMTIMLDSYPPELVVTSPRDKMRTRFDFVWVRGDSTPGDKVSIGSQSLTVPPDGHFDLKVSLDQPVNRIIVVASDEAGNVVSVERLVFMAESTEGLTGHPFLDENCTSLLVLVLVGVVTLGIILSFLWRGDDVLDRREKALQQVMEEDNIELDKPHLEPTSGYLQYDPTSPTGRMAEFEEQEDEEFVSIEEFRRQMENGDGPQ